VTDGWKQRVQNERTPFSRISWLEAIAHAVFSMLLLEEEDKDTDEVVKTFEIRCRCTHVEKEIGEQRMI
jgi:hypothetical protein